MRKKMIFIYVLAFLVLSTSSFTLIVPLMQQPTETVLTNPVTEWKNLSQKERNLRVKQAKKEIKNFKKEKRNGSDADTNTLLLVILAILLPPLAVYLHQGEINTKFWISLILTLLFWLPGVIYALIVILGGA